MTTKSIVALELLSKNKDKFDLVISDIHMLDMDGFKFWSLWASKWTFRYLYCTVLIYKPVLSDNGAMKAVMKGITHGACDCLLKPIWIEEVKNIWQHVVRERKFDTGYHNNVEDGLRAQISNPEIMQGHGNHSGKANRNRNDQNEEDDEDPEENVQDNEDSFAQKKQGLLGLLSYMENLSMLLIN